eukprot:Opistho-2@32248
MQQVSPMLVDLCVQMGWRKVGVLSTNDDYGRSLASGFQKAVSEHGGITAILTESASRDSNGVMDFSSQLGVLKRENIRIIFLLTYNPESYLALKTADTLGMIGPHYVWISEQSKSLVTDQLPQIAPPSELTAATALFAGMLFYTPAVGQGPLYDTFLRYFARRKAWYLNGTTPHLPIVTEEPPPLSTVDPTYLPIAPRAVNEFDCVLTFAHAISDSYATLVEAGVDITSLSANLSTLTTMPRDLPGGSNITVGGSGSSGSPGAAVGADDSDAVPADFTFGDLLMNKVRATSFVGASGPIAYDGNGDPFPRYVLWNLVYGRNVQVGDYSGSTGLAITSRFVYNGGSTTNPGDGQTSDGMPAGTIVGIVFGSIGGLLLLGVLFLAGRATRRAKQRAREQVALRKAEEERRREALAQTQIATAGDRMKSVFLANMSHEIRSPLNSILGISELLEEDMTRPAERESLAMIRRSGESLLLILNDILDFSRLEADMMDVKTEPFDPMGVVEDVVSLHAEIGFRKGIETSFHVCCGCAACANTTHTKATSSDSVCMPESLMAVGDSSRFTQVLSNLVSNAVKFTDSGHVTVCVRAARRVPEGQCSLAADDSATWPSHVVERTSTDTPSHQSGAVGMGDRFLLIEVHDSGIGLPADEMPRLFLRFQQGDNSMSKRYQGTGLGLAISASLIQLMGGKIGVRSSQGRGSIFWCTLPLSQGRCGPDAGAGAGGRMPVGAPEGTVALLSGDPIYLASARTCCMLLGVMCTPSADASLATAPLLRSSNPPALASGSSYGIQTVEGSILADWDWFVGTGYGDARTMRPPGGSPSHLSWFKAPPRGTGPIHAFRKPITRAKVMVALTGQAPDYASASVLNFDGTSQQFDATQTPSESDGMSFAAESIASAIEALAASAKTAASPNGTSPSMALKVLIADDNTINQKVALRMVCSMGYAGVTVDNGARAVDAYLAAPGTFGIILMDLQMPVMDGLDAARQIRSAEAERGLSRVPIFALSASTASDVSAACAAYGMDGFVEKPFQRAQLERTVRSACAPRT